MSKREEFVASMDPITFEVVRNGFSAMCTQASRLIERVAYGPVITQGHDYSVGLLTADGRLVAHGIRDITPHMGTYEASLQCVHEDVDEIRPGDVYIMNDPYRGGTHTLDVRLIRPVFVDGELFAFTVSCCHWSDMGGPVPATFNPQATESYAEGLFIPVTRVYEKDKPVKSAMELIRLNVRVPYERFGDMAAQYRAIRLMENRLLEYVEKYGKKTILNAFEEVMNYSERIFRKEVAEIPDGTYEFVDYIDHDEGHPDKPRVKIHCKLIIQGDQVTFDWTDSDMAPKGPSGLTLPACLSATFDGTLHCFPHLAPLNHGVIRAIKVITQPGSACHVLPPTPMAGYCASGYEKVDTAAMCAWGLAFSQTKPERVFAGTVNLSNCCFGGFHPKTGRRYVSYTWLEGGQGARSYKDGPSFAMMLYGAGATNQPIEIHERWYPFLYTHCEAIQDSCGDGKYRGGFGIHRNFYVMGDAVNSIHGDREEVTPPGLGGGTNGGPNKLILNHGTAEERNLGMYACNVKLKKGDHITFGSNGGGGYGNPLERDPNLVLEDVIDEFLSMKKAREVYGVAVKVIDAEALQYEVDWEDTKRLRAELAKRQPKIGFGPGEVHPYGVKVVARDIR